MNKIKGFTRYLLVNFGPLFGFYLINHFWGLRAAVLGSLAITIVEILRLKIRREKVTAFFIFSAVIAIGFGVLDLNLDEPIFFKFEAGITNLLFAGFFGFSLLKPKPIIQEFAEQQGRIDQKQSEDRTFFFRLLTVFWTVYFVTKAAAYTWINLHNSIEEGMVLRALIGNVSFAIMMFISVGLARPILAVLAKAKLLPSQRGSLPI